MVFETKFKTKPELKPLENIDVSHSYSLILYNDDFNTFDHVIACLVEYCGHSKIQAEQCTYLVHYTGKADVKSGSLEILKPISESLSDEGLTVEIA